jgi:hypothetical protein
MSRFFSDIQGYFKATYSGRYLALILAELFRQDHDAFTRILNEAGINYKHRRGDSAVANRWLFPIMAQWRFADIAVINAAGDPIVLIEIKDADIRNEGNAAQLDDYLEFIGEKKNKNVKFLFLSRTIPPEKDERKLRTAKSKKRVHRLFFRQLHKPLKGSKIFGQMLMDYLEDINVALSRSKTRSEDHKLYHEPHARYRRTESDREIDTGVFRNRLRESVVDGPMDSEQ